MCACVNMRWTCRRGAREEERHGVQDNGLGRRFSGCKVIRETSELFHRALGLSINHVALEAGLSDHRVSRDRVTRVRTAVGRSSQSTPDAARRFAPSGAPISLELGRD